MAASGDTSPPCPVSEAESVPVNLARSRHALLKSSCSLFYCALIATARGYGGSPSCPIGGDVIFATITDVHAYLDDEARLGVLDHSLVSSLDGVSEGSRVP